MSKKHFINIFFKSFFCLLLFFIVISCSDSLFGYSESPGLLPDEADVPAEVEPAPESENDAEKTSEPEPEPEPVESAETLDSSAPSDSPDSPALSDASDSASSPESAESSSQIPTSSPSLVSFLLSAFEDDLSVSVEKKGSAYILTPSADYEAYYWKMGDTLLSTEKILTLDTSSFETDFYPLVLFAERGEILYSSSLFLSVKATSARTVFPYFSAADFSDFTLKVFSLLPEESLVMEKVYSSMSELEKENLTLEAGSYRFVLTASGGLFTFSDSKEVALDSGSKSRIVFSLSAASYKSLQSQKSFGSTESESAAYSYGKLDMVDYFPSDIAVDDVSVQLYRETEGAFKLFDFRKNLVFYKGSDAYEGMKYIRYSAQVPPGLYWFRCDCSCENFSQSCYNMELIYVSPASQSCMIIENSSFYKMYSIDYDLKGGFFTGKKLKEKTASFEGLVLPSESEMCRPGYVFSGWYLDSDCTLPAKNEYPAGSIKKGMKFSACWKKSEEDFSKNELNQKCSHLSVNESSSSIELRISDAVNDEIFIVEVYNSAGNRYDVQCKNVSFSEGVCSMNLDFRCRKEESYLICLSAYKKTELLDDSKISELAFCEKYVFVPDFTHF
ncbi:MAG: hypothetical protein IJ688_06850 [Treponema sp.]|nr:hypothetical protein [Treponema sp.]